MSDAHNDPKLIVHCDWYNGVDIKSTGKFYAYVGGKLVTRDSLPALKELIDAKLGAQAPQEDA